MFVAMATTPNIAIRKQGKPQCNWGLHRPAHKQHRSVPLAENQGLSTTHTTVSPQKVVWGAVGKCSLQLAAECMAKGVAFCNDTGRKWRDTSTNFVSGTGSGSFSCFLNIFVVWAHEITSQKLADCKPQLQLAVVTVPS